MVERFSSSVIRASKVTSFLADTAHKTAKNYRNKILNFVTGSRNPSAIAHYRHKSAGKMTYFTELLLKMACCNQWYKNFSTIFAHRINNLHQSQTLLLLLLNFHEKTITTGMGTHHHECYRLGATA
jgi:hypothetical protein